MLHRPNITALKKIDTGEGERQAVKGQTCKDLVPGYLKDWAKLDMAVRLIGKDGMNYSW